MGVGHVPTGPLREAGQGDDVPRRQHRGDRQPLRRQGAVADRLRIGRTGELLARRFLEARGARVLASNLRVGRDEIDLLIAAGPTRAIVEVKTTLAGMNPAENLTDAQLDNLLRAGRRLRPAVHRIDLVCVVLGPSGADLRWLRNVA